MKKLHLMGLAALFAAPMAFAGDMPAGQFAGFVTMTSAEVDGTGGAPPAGFDFDDDGTGFGLRGWGTVAPNLFVHGEYQTVGLDDTDLDVNQLRLGGGYAMDVWLVKAEYIDFGSDLDQAGFGVHGGLHTMSDQVGFFGTVGYLTTDDSDGIELNAGVSFAFNPQFSGVVDYRTYLGSLDPDGDLTLSDLRVGVAYNFQ
jgi:hypothetical protein